MTTYKYQNDAIEELIEKFKTLYKVQSDETPTIILKAPTGSGKTYIAESFINKMSVQPDFNEDIAFIWMTCSDTLAIQSLEKYREYFFPNTNSRLLTADDIERTEFLLKNDILFSNWQKYNISKEKFDKRTLRKPNDENRQKESGFYFDDLIENTHNQNRKIVLLIDESHAYDSKLAQESVIQIINPKIIIKISATPFKTEGEKMTFYAQKGMGFADIVEVNRQDVIDAGRIKESIVTQTEEDILNYKVKDEDIEKLLLQLAIEKKNQIKAEWEKLNMKINPLVMIQLPNDSKTNKATEIQTKKERILQILKELGVPERKIATKLSESSERMDEITKNDSEVEFLLFKLAAATGWDCPRAHILVRYREIKSESFETQTLGRILRMACVRKDLNNPILRTGYLFTNFPRSDVHIPDETDKNKAKVIHTQLNPEFRKKALKNEISDSVQNLFTNQDSPKKSEISKIIENDSQIKDEISNIQSIFDTEIENINFLPENSKFDSQTFEIEKTKIQNQTNEIKTKIEETNSIQKIVEKISQNLSDFSENDKQLFEQNIKEQIEKIVQKTTDIATGNVESEIILDKNLKSDFLSRADYGDLGKVSVFRKNFILSMNKFFKIEENELYSPSDLEEKFTQKGVKLDSSLKKEIMVNAKFVSEDENDKQNEIGKNIEYEESQNNVETLFSELCYEILTKQTEEDAKVGNIARSYSAFRQTIVLWLKNHAFPFSDYLSSYKIFINDCRTNGIFKNAITQSLKDYRKILDEYITERENSNSVSLPFSIKTHYSYTADYEIIENAKKSFVQPFYFLNGKNGSKNELAFINYLESSQNVIHWFKNGDNGKDFFGIKYFDTTENRNRLFYPDWLVELDDGRICILDTKGGITATSTETKDKAEELYRRISLLNQTGTKKYIGGIVIQSNANQWYINSNKTYEYKPNDLTNWKTLAWKEL